jgi:hypothetical protein
MVYLADDSSFAGNGVKRLKMDAASVHDIIPQGDIPNIRIMYNNIEHSISIDFYIYISIFQVF